MLLRAVVALACVAMPMPMLHQTASSAAPANPTLELMRRAWVHAEAHGAKQKPVLSPEERMVLNGSVPVEALHAEGFKVVPWTSNDPETMRKLIRAGVDGIISDRPDLLHRVVTEERAAAMTPEQREALARFDMAAHRGGRGLRPENTLPSFESGMDQGATTLETDTGVTTDHVSLIWHDQFLNPESCRHADGTPYTMANRVYTRDISNVDAQKTFICDKLHPKFPDQRNDLALSPVAVAFAKQEGMGSPYAPTNAAQLFRFVKFYTAWYATGPGKAMPEAAERAHTGATVRFNLETKILPDNFVGTTNPPHPGLEPNHTVGPQVFVDTLVGAVKREGMTERAEIQSFDFRTLLLVQAQHPELPTYYLLEDTALLSTTFTPEALRLPPAQ